MPADVVIQLYDKLAYWIADNAPKDWRRVEIKMEMPKEKVQTTGNTVIECFTGENHVKTEFATPAVEKTEMQSIFLKLNEIAEESSERWTVCNFAVLSSGNYDVEYQYESPS